ncbi:ejaculatory bulb-specific protein 3-like [Diorhabda carinulata]|uniref:ejaculatory bulb-specific protein 3-like n=1 Tax=Diorhabda carinulata TaxID=1163345 RepID=UPI0025A20434|nr:ejaculatory bulb-specific protein 3-like [Diorhabda carinulata]
MKLAIVVCVALVIVAVSAAPSDEKYTSKYDNVNLDDIIKSDRLLRNYIDCLLGTKKCTKDAEELKGVLPDALKTKCAKCTDAQKEGAKKILRHLLKNKREWFNELEAHYDPDHVYIKSYEKELKEEGIQV